MPNKILLQQKVNLRNCVRLTSYSNLANATYCTHIKMHDVQLQCRKMIKKKITTIFIIENISFIHPLRENLLLLFCNFEKTCSIRKQRYSVYAQQGS